MSKILKITLAVLLTVLLIPSIFLLVRYQKASVAHSAQLEDLAEQARGYETELQRLRRESETQEMHISKPDGPGAAVIAFRIDGSDTLNRALAYGESYDFKPAILINTADDADELFKLLKDTGLDVILYSRGLADDETERVQQLQKAMTEAGCVDTRSYLLRSSDDSEESRSQLAQAGIQTLFLYSDTLNSDYYEDGTAELNYSFIHKSGYTPRNRVASLANSEQGLLFAIDMKETTVTEHQMDEIVRFICDEAKSGSITVGSVSNAVQTVRQRVEREQLRLKEFQNEEQSRKERIEELEAAIQEIYSHWDD